MPRQPTPAHADPQVLARFWAKVVKCGPDDCWPWSASRRHKGYGAFAYTLGGKLVQDRAHRFSYVVHVGVVPDGLCVLHRCDNPVCVNPAHLFLGTRADNNADMVAKGRHVPACTYTRRGPNDPAGNHPKGVEHPNARLTPEVVRGVRADRVAGLSYSTLASKYGITIRHAWRIVHRKAWKHLDALDADSAPGAFGPEGHNSPRGQDSPAAKLTEDDVREICRLRREVVKLKVVAARFGITESNVSYIARGKGWKHVE
jgi:hypothetical protein